MFLNCGANVNLEEHLSLQKYAELDNKILLTVLDSHRPFDLANMQEPDEDQPFEVRRQRACRAWPCERTANALAAAAIRPRLWGGP